MKIRTGFVSNSSSSSFFVIGENLYFDDIELLTGVNVVLCLGKSLSDGRDIFELTPEIYNYIKSLSNSKRYKLLSRIRFVLKSKDFNLVNDDDWEVATFKVVNPVNIGSSFECFYGEKDYHSTENLESFISNYIESFED